MRRLLTLAVLLIVIGVAWLAYRTHDRPDLATNGFPVLETDPQPGRLRVSFLGVATLLISDGQTALLTDGFFTRPSLWRTLIGRVEPDRQAITAALQRAGIDKLAAVIVVHSHYDHSMDAPEVAQRTGAVLVGSASTANVGRGWGLPEESIRVVSSGDTLSFGRFRVTLVGSKHLPHGMAMGEITEPLRPPVRATEYKEGGSYSVLIEHDGRRLLVQGSAGWVDGALKPYQADVVFLGVGGLGSWDDDYKSNLWREVVQTLGARRVIPIHFDDFTQPFEEPLPLMPRLIDNVDQTFAFLRQQAQEQHVDLRLLPIWKPVDPFAGLP
jgi:L-ascorbate metabolism protein UlaG (beta-lactamase superfamily)